MQNIKLIFRLWHLYYLLKPLKANLNFSNHKISKSNTYSKGKIEFAKMSRRINFNFIDEPFSFFILGRQSIEHF